MSQNLLQMTDEQDKVLRAEDHKLSALELQEANKKQKIALQEIEFQLAEKDKEISDLRRRLVSV